MDNNEFDNEMLPEETDPQAEIESPSGKFFKAIFDHLETVIISVLAAILVFTFGFRLCTVNGASMNQTLQHNDKVVVADFGYTPKRGDVVVFHLTNNTYKELLVKRVIATEGEWIDIEPGSWKVRIADNPEMENATVLDEPYKYLDGAYYGSTLEFPVQVPEGHIFVMGDNRNNSADSRSPSVGFIKEERVLGKVVFSLVPFGKIEN